MTKQIKQNKTKKQITSTTSKQKSKQGQPDKTKIQFKI